MILCIAMVGDNYLIVYTIVRGMVGKCRAEELRLFIDIMPTDATPDNMRLASHLLCPVHESRATIWHFPRHPIDAGMSANDANTQTSSKEASCLHAFMSSRMARTASRKSFRLFEVSARYSCRNCSNSSCVGIGVLVFREIVTFQMTKPLLGLVHDGAARPSPARALAGAGCPFPQLWEGSGSGERVWVG